MTVTTYALWEGATRRDVYRDEFLAERDHLADAARDGDWRTVLRAVAGDPALANSRRIGGRSGYSPLHQAAWHGVSAVAEELVAAGGWRTLRSTDGERPMDIAASRGHHGLIPLLLPTPCKLVPYPVLQAVEPHLHALIRARAQELAGHRELSLPQVSVLTELAVPAMSFPVPGMYGSFLIKLQHAEGEGPVRLEVTSNCRVAGGSGQTHHITADGCTLVEDGWG